MESILSLLIAVLAWRFPLVGSIVGLSSFGRQLETRLSQALSLVPTFSSFRRDLYTAATAEAQYVAAHAQYIQCARLALPAALL